MSEDPLLQGRRLTRSFGKKHTKVTALKDVSLSLNRGEVTLLMGPSGSGKSTLLAVLSGLLAPDEGEVIALQKSLWSITDGERKLFRQQHVGFVFQGFNLLPALQARQQLEIVLRWGEGISAGEARRRAEDMLKQLGMGERLHQRPDELSGGEKQRVAIGRALVKQPRFCFADEPTNALNWEHGEKVIQLLQQAAHERQAAILIVAHDQRIIPYADRVWNLEDGRLFESEEHPGADGGSHRK